MSSQYQLQLARLNIELVPSKMVDIRHSKKLFFEQYVKVVRNATSQYASDDNTAYISHNITGKPSIFPEYGDFPQSFVMRTYGKWWEEAPSRLRPIMCQSFEKYNSHDFIELEFEVPVFPVSVRIFETYNPGSVVKIWAFNYEDWTLLWEGDPQCVGHSPRIFSPILRVVNFKTRIIRLEFYHSHLEYYTELDAVLLIGTILPVNWPPCLSNRDLPIGKLASELLELRVNSIPPQLAESRTLKFMLGIDFPRFLLRPKEHNKPLHLSGATGQAFNCLPNEIILHIFGYLDLRSLCRCAQVSKRFRILAMDATLYTEITLKPYWYCTTPSTLQNLRSRTKNLQKLDLSWVGSMHGAGPLEFINFVSLRGGLLTSLRLNSAGFMNNVCLIGIGITCKNLKELSLRNCVGVSDHGFLNLAVLHDLEYLDLYKTSIELDTLQCILEANHNLKHLNVGSCIHISNMDDLVSTIGEHNQQLVSVDFWKTHGLTSQGVATLSYCPNLEEVDIGWCLTQESPLTSLILLASRCPRLKKLGLTAMRQMVDSNLEPLVQLCPVLEQLDLLGIESISPRVCKRFLQKCKHLKFLDISFCNQILESQVTMWRRLYPNVNIKRSFQHISNITPTVDF